MARIAGVSNADGLASAFGSTVRVSRKRKSPDVPFDMLDVEDTSSFSSNIDYAVNPDGVCLPLALTTASQAAQVQPPLLPPATSDTPTMHVTPALRDALSANHPLLHSPKVPVPTETQALVVYNPQPWQRGTPGDVVDAQAQPPCRDDDDDDVMLLD